MPVEASGPHADSMRCSSCQRRDCAESRGEISREFDARTERDTDCSRPGLMEQQSNNLIMGENVVRTSVFIRTSGLIDGLSVVDQDLPFMSRCRQDTGMTHVDARGCSKRANTSAATE